MEVQKAIVVVVIALAAAFISVTLLRKLRSFSPKQKCGDDCGCNASSKKLHS